MGPAWWRPTTAGVPFPELMSTSAPAVRMAVDTSSFALEVLERSQDRPVVVDFWASWCGPCRQLGPILEAAVDEMGGTVLLRTLDVDGNPELAQRYSVRGIPAVKAFKDGDVAAEFVGAQPASAVRSFLKGLLPSRADLLVEAGDEISLREALASDPSHLPARRLLTRLLLDAGEYQAAEDLALQAPQDRECDGLAAWAQLASQHLDDPAYHPLWLALQDSAWEAVADSALVLMAGRPVSERDQLRRVALLAFERLGADHPSTIAARSRMATLLY